MTLDIEYKLAKHLTIRDNDKALFDAHSFCILKFNPVGYQLISEFCNKPLKKNDFVSVAKKLNVSEKDSCEFIDKCINQGILVSDKK